MKIPLMIVAEFIAKESENIESLDSKSLPEVLAEIQGEEAQNTGVDDHRTIKEVSIEAIMIVLPCWASDYGFPNWEKKLMKAAKKFKSSVMVEV